MTTLTRRYELACAHYLNGLGPNHKCSRLHGHNYIVELTVAPGAAGLVNGMVIDSDVLDGDVRRVLYSKERGLDHRCLNELGGKDKDLRRAFGELPEQPTAENFARYLWDALQFLSNDGKQRLVNVRVYEESWLWADCNG